MGPLPEILAFSVLELHLWSESLALTVWWICSLQRDEIEDAFGETGFPNYFIP